LTGIIFDIQRFSVHDGPGIRTTVFMKGCPLRCRWCHNPEGLTKKQQLQFFEEKCIGCGLCGEKNKLSDAKCCPTDALTVCGKYVTEQEILTEILKDKVFYANEGGVTFSGGECLLQADFVTAVLEQAKKSGLHTAVDTCGYVPWTEIEKTLSVCDLYLYDIKSTDSVKHREYTGVDNTLIIENLKKLSRLDKEIWIRIPVIPDFNDSEDEMSSISDLVASLPSVKQVTLMPYHTLGASKYKTLGLVYPYDTSKKISEKKLCAFKEIFEDRGVVIK
jgi:pyruvate formate lyase activating enzyme